MCTYPRRKTIDEINDVGDVHRMNVLYFYQTEQVNYLFIYLLLLLILYNINVFVIIAI